MSMLSGGLGLLADFVWNAQHGWAGANQLADRVGLSSRASWVSIWPVLSFLGGEAVALGVIWWIVGLARPCGILTRLSLVQIAASRRRRRDTVRRRSRRQSQRA